MDTAPTVAEESSRTRPARAVACAVVAAAAWFVPWGLEPRAHATLVVLFAVGGLWLTEALPLGASALLVPVLGILLGAAKPAEAFSGFGDPIVFLFLGTFLLTDAASRHGLDRRLADRVIGSPWVRASPARLLFAIALLGCVVSAWVNNTATTAMLLPLAMTAQRFGSRSFLASVLLMTSYAPSLGGLATPVGTAPNLIGLAQIEKFTGSRPSFGGWTLMFAPLAVLSTLGAAAWLRARGGRTTPADCSVVTSDPLPWSRAERTLCWVAAFVIVLWIAPGLLVATPLLSEPWVVLWKDRFPEACVPLAGGLALMLLPSGAADGSRISDVRTFRSLDWSTLLLFGGGISLGGMMQASGLAEALGHAIFGVVPIQGTFGICLASALMAVIVSEFTSNTASAALVVPVVLALAKAADVDPVPPALAATVGCSFGFMLPVSTPPNALVYGTGKLTIAEMVRCGLLLDVAGALFVAAWVTLVA
jgi:sodium-dependent dicarboxylate transporter 2/3/5